MNSTEKGEKGEYKRLTWPELREAAKGNWGEIFETLAPALSDAVANAPFHVACPVHGGQDGYRLFEHFNDTGRGVCNTCGPQKSGFDTLMWVKKYAFEDALREVAQWLRHEIPHAPRIPRVATPILPKMDPALAYKKIAEVWRASLPLMGTPAERYLIKRGIWAENLPRTLRAHPGLGYYDKKTKSFLGTFPCLLAPIKDKDGNLISLHRIFLTPDGLKADVPDPKKMMNACGALNGCAIKLYEAGEILGVAEGIETALAVHAISRLPVWSCITAGLLEQVDIPASVKKVVIWADLDRSQRGITAANALADRLEPLGLKVEICLPPGPIPEGKKGVDWLDVMNLRGINGFPAHWRRWRPAEVDCAL